MKLSLVTICTVALIYVASVATVDAEPIPNPQHGDRSCSPEEVQICKESGKICMKICSVGISCAVCPGPLPASPLPEEKKKPNTPAYPPKKEQKPKSKPKPRNTPPKKTPPKKGYEEA
ncbi:hypothetical protein BDF19DRAFT_424811 [Syncephalis fuscata]|nr:hypothetical protein BDF19DRAFT_424811 [Syncephalis fuscata]